MHLHKGIGVFLSLAGMALAADIVSPRENVSRRVYTIGVDARTGRLVRVPANRYSRTLPSRPVQSRPVAAVQQPEKLVPEKVIQAQEVSSEPARGPVYNVVTPQSFDELIEQVASRYEIRPSFVHAVIKTESNYNPRAASPKGALGLMQLMPQTARRFGVRDIFDPTENVVGGVRYLRYLLDLYPDNSALSLAAYNAGEGAVERFGGVPPYPETRQYVRRVNNFYKLYQSRENSRVTPPPAPQKLSSPRILQSIDASGFVRYTTISE